MNNNIILSVEIVSEPVFSHQYYGQNFFIIHMSANRNSGVEDVVPVLISDSIFDVNSLPVGTRININGELRSYNKVELEQRKLILNVFAKEVFYVNETAPDTNEILLDGFICKEPVYRKTPLGREITDLLLAVNRSYGKADHIPCICWGNNAVFANSLKVGSRVYIEGRMQSRAYTKTLPGGLKEERTAYEVSVGRVEEISGEE